jgi:hypothetical protein
MTTIINNHLIHAAHILMSSTSANLISATNHSILFAVTDSFIDSQEADCTYPSLTTLHIPSSHRDHSIIAITDLNLSGFLTEQQSLINHNNLSARNHDLFLDLIVLNKLVAIKAIIATEPSYFVIQLHATLTATQFDNILPHLIANPLISEDYFMITTLDYDTALPILTSLMNRQEN